MINSSSSENIVRRMLTEKVGVVQYLFIYMNTKNGDMKTEVYFLVRNVVCQSDRIRTPIFLKSAERRSKEFAYERCVLNLETLKMRQPNAVLVSQNQLRLTNPQI